MCSRCGAVPRASTERFSISATARMGAVLTVNASSARGWIAGVVRNSAEPVDHARVALVEEDTHDWIWVIGANNEGRYSFPHLRPGKYQVLALDGRPINAFALRWSLFDYADIVETVELGAGEQATRDLRQHEGKL